MQNLSYLWGMSYLDSAEVRQFDNLELLARQIVEGFIIGLHKSPYHGFSVEFAEHRIYNPGESTRNIDWKVYGRTDKMFVKRYEEETNLRCQLVVDISPSMYFPEEALSKGSYENKIGFASLAAASLMHLLRGQRDAFGLTLFDNEIKTHTHCKSSTVHYRLLLSLLEQSLKAKPERGETRAADALHEVAERIHKRSLVVILSDMFDPGTDPEPLFSALQHLVYNKHEVVLIHVTDKAYELDFNFENRPYLFEDMETGEKLRIQPNQVKEFYNKQMGDYLALLREKCLQYRIDYVEADVQQGFAPVLQSYLTKRSKMRI
jgi:uncharacterized protein (DUF58 family)